ncbi:MAG: chemotaxis protein CheW [Chloroflexi bacterium]|nr:chemotaxis protein CheW [Chloroflexota bacterium]
MANEITAMRKLRFIRCNIGEESYGLDMSWVRSIQRADQIKPVAELKPRFLADKSKNDVEADERTGFFDEARNRIGWLPAEDGDIPVYSLASRLGRTTTTLASYGRVVVLNPVIIISNRPWALLVDRVSQVVEISSEQLVPLPALVNCSSSNYFRGAIRLEEELVLLLAPELVHPDAAPRARQSPNAALRPATDFKNHVPSAPPVFSDTKKKARRDKQILLFSTSDPVPGERALSFALSITQVPEILNTAQLTRVPGAPSFVLGLINWRNRLVPVIDLNARLGLRSAEGWRNERSRLLIVRSSGESKTDVYAGLVIRPTIRALRLPVAYKPCQSSPVIEKHFVSGIIELEKETVAIPDLPQILRY